MVEEVSSHTGYRMAKSVARTILALLTDVHRRNTAWGLTLLLVGATAAVACAVFVGGFAGFVLAMSGVTAVAEDD